MVYLSTLLDEVDTKPRFKFHPRCSKIRITPLLFSNDLLLFSYGSVEAVKAVSQCLGLEANLDKCELYIAGSLI